jgi:hypothetical protein
MPLVEYAVGCIALKCPHYHGDKYKTGPETTMEAVPGSDDDSNRASTWNADTSICLLHVRLRRNLF